MANDVLLEILDLARWAPSGDNTQPWRFEIRAHNRLVIHGFDTRSHCVYDFDGHPSQIALGALLENIALAAGRHRLRALITRRDDVPDATPTFDVAFEADESITPNPLSEVITKRAVQRRPLSTRALTARDKSVLADALSGKHRVLWLESGADRRRVARMLWSSARLRLTIPEAYAVHRSVIAWNSRYSEDKVPDQAIGLDPIATKLMGWVMQSWGRVEFFNRYLAGTVMPRVQLDLLPGLLCGAHFAIVAQSPPSGTDDYVAGGRAMQRFWLTATHLGLHMQPEMTPLIFSHYARNNARFSTTATAAEQARAIEEQFRSIVGADVARCATFFGRIGHGRAPTARSTRLPLDKLLREPAHADA